MSSDRDEPRPRVTLRIPRVAEVVAAELRRRIIEGDLVDGSELPTEAVLLQEFPASRPSLREAFRILETEGLLVVRRGKHGGTVIKSPIPENAAYHMGLLLHSRRIPLQDLATARRMLEPLCAEQAALREDHAEAGQHLRSLVKEAQDQLKDGVVFTSAAIGFHEALVDAAGNQTLRVIVGMLESVWSTQEMDWAESAADTERYPGIELRRSVLRAHGAIAAAIEKGDAGAAVEVTRTHLDASQDYVASDDTQLVRILDAYGAAQMPRPRAREHG